MTGQDIIDEARKYLGIPYQNQGRDLNGVDCGGLLLVVGRSLGISELEHLGYSNSPDGETFEALLDQECDRVEDFANPRVGDILAMDYGKGIQHTAFVTSISPRLKVIHAKRREGVAKNRGRGVVEHYLHGKDLKCWKLTYRIRGLEPIN